MIYYLPGYNLTATRNPLQGTSYFVRLHKEYIREVLQELRYQYHYVYVLLEKMPDNRFAIIRYNDYLRNRIKPDALVVSDHFSLQEFLDCYEQLHEEDLFRVIFYTEVFYTQQGFEHHTLERVFQHYLKQLCIQKLRENAPMGVTGDLFRKLPLTEADTRIVGSLISCYNAEAVEELRLQYSALSKLHCLKKTSE